MDDIRAAIGLAQLDKIEADLKKREEIRKLYVKALNKIDSIVVPFTNHNGFSSNYIFPIILKNSNYKIRDAVREKLVKAGIQTSVHYPAVHRFSIYNDLYSELTNTDYAADNLITLPMYSKLTNNEIKYISDHLLKAISNG
jgi:dTDP-4-amino-4,6-dideoxygalactose transaminase